MVPAVDKKDTEQLLNDIREQIESTRQEILSWTLPKEQTSNDSEAQALRKLAARSAQQTRQWTGRMLKELDTVYPYPHSADSSTDVIDKTSVPQVPGYNLPVEFPVVRRIKHARMSLALVSGELSTLLEQCIPGSFFNQCLFRAQEHAIQTSMWLGELLHEFYEAQPKAEPMNLTPWRETSLGEFASDKVEAEAPKNDASPSTSLPTEEPSTATPTSGSDSEPTSPSASELSGSEPALLEVEGASEMLTADAKPETSAKSVRK